MPFGTCEWWLRFQRGEVTGFETGDAYIDFEATEGATQGLRVDDVALDDPASDWPNATASGTRRSTGIDSGKATSGTAYAGPSAGSRRRSATPKALVAADTAPAFTPDDQLPRTGIFASSTRRSIVSTASSSE